MSDPEARDESQATGWSRTRGIVAAVLAAGVVVAALVLSRLDLANELAVVRSELAAASAEVEEADVENEELEQESQRLSEAVQACADAVRLSEEVRTALDALTEGLQKDDQRALARGLLTMSELSQDWQAALAGCGQAAEAPEE